MAVLALIILVSSCGPTYYSDSFIATYVYHPKVKLYYYEDEEGVIYCAPAADSTCIPDNYLTS